ncbi:TPA: trypsin-like peptidase domain-containing protein [Streptococcus pyogenes]|uniref:S1C family serine protease n=2 Tax=Bacilli TaxID=91061 RepID=UPI000DA28FC8|nr:trypsin-like peptidase domain-containing protein [Streptococcus pyogenes]NSX82927.1 trypsin-like peptidase domain-containing protein [Streptococcus pyogenes]SQF33551.1 endopeptidase [Streptococcus pyogenes]HEP4943327.1 trypsin-like peptidase domain-containing protein [Streptococcus pyogenes]HEP5386004.1 trypsin-like peptidase domain-containing protein [Streptococcus pyogenes]HEP5638030.1 trypsin-like peptidase domain-containing protein [Streptococcus pyogenes]
MPSMKHILKSLSILLVGFLGGLIAIITFNNLYPHSPSKINSGKATTSNMVFNNTTNTTKAVKAVQNAVVSVINYQDNPSSSLSNPYTKLFGEGRSKENKDAELSIFSEGSGVIYRKDGNSAYVVTNNHVIDGAKRIEILMADGSKVVGELVGADTYSDLAVVKISSDKIKTVAEFADSTKLNVGEVAIAIGSPLGTQYANSVTQGIVSSLSRTVTLKNENGETVSTNAIQTDAAINPGNSGGPLINIEGQVIGINSSKISSTPTGSNGNSGAVEGIGFAIPSTDVIKIIKQLETNGEVIRPALGISMVNLNDLSTNALSQINIPTSVTGGIVVAEVKEGMPASGKLAQYDVITEIDGKIVNSISDLQSSLYGHDINDTIKVTFYRGTTKKKADIKLTKTTQDLTKTQ